MKNNAGQNLEQSTDGLVQLKLVTSLGLDTREAM